MTIMAHNNEPISDYDPNASLDDVLAALVEIDSTAATEAENFMATPAPTPISGVDAALDAFLASRPRVAKEVKNFMEATSPHRKDRRIMQCIKDGRYDDFKRDFRVALATPYGTRTVAHLWARNHLRNEELRHPEVANLLLGLPSFIASLEAKEFLVFVENLVESKGFVPGQHWMVVTARASRLLPGHIVMMLINQGKLENPVTATAFVTCKSLLKRIIEDDWRMKALRLAFLTCDLPPRWASFARRIGLTDADIGELITLRCNHITKKHEARVPLSRQDIGFLKMLLMPAGPGGVSYREVLSSRQLCLVVDAVRRCLSSLPTVSTDDRPTFSSQERKILTTLRAQTMGKRYRRR